MDPAYSLTVVDWIGSQWSAVGVRLGYQFVVGLLALAIGLGLTVLAVSTSERYNLAVTLVFDGAILGGPVMSGQALWRGRKPFRYYAGLLWLRLRLRRPLFGDPVRRRASHFALWVLTVGGLTAGWLASLHLLGDTILGDIMLAGGSVAVGMVVIRSIWPES
jgi:hypothetical protein